MIPNHKFITCLIKGEIPEAPPEALDGYEYRKIATERNMWAIVTQDWVKELAEWIGDQTVLEIMSGAGWLAKALYSEGIKILATDNYSWKHYNKKLVFDVKVLDGISAVKDFKNQYNLLLVSWPPYDKDQICRICEEWGEEKPIIYIGEHEGGCNAVDEFFQHFDFFETFDIPQWFGMHDELMIGYYKKEVIE
jgi:hypothetical protein